LRRPAGGGAKRISDHGGRKRSHRAAGDALISISLRVMPSLQTEIEHEGTCNIVYPILRDLDPLLRLVCVHTL
jgi:hypothetical protein